jgi:arsenate reductase
MGCGEACPVVPGLRREDWPLEDPKGKPMERVREIRDEVRGRVEDLPSAPRSGWLMRSAARSDSPASFGVAASTRRRYAAMVRSVTWGYAAW